MPRLAPSQTIGNVRHPTLPAGSAEGINFKLPCQTALAFARTWRHADLKDQVLGRIATRIAIVLMGKHKPIFDQSSKFKSIASLHARSHAPTLPTDDCGDYVVVTNAKSVIVTGKKLSQKLYRHHSGFPGGLKEIPFKTLLEKKPEEVPSSSPLSVDSSLMRMIDYPSSSIGNVT